MKTMMPPALMVVLLLSHLTLVLGSAGSDIIGSSSSISVTDYGASGDGRRYDTAAIQAAIDACAASGGGRVVFPSSKSYLTATILLRSGVFLVVEKGATILGGTRQGDYPDDPARWYVVLAENATGAGITGGGEINGQGEAFIARRDPRKNIMVSWNSTGSCSGDECRPRLVGFIDSSQIRVWNITLNQPAYWCLHLVRCDESEISDVEIYGDWDSPNNDGIDIEDSNNTAITRCRIDTGDDAICPKSTTGPVRNLTATDCWIRTKSSAIKLGSASFHDFTHMYFHNITIVDSHRGLAVQIRDGGSADDIVFSNISITTRYYDPSWWGRAEPIYITTCPRDPSTAATNSTVSRIRFVNITAVSENGVFLSGTGGGRLVDIGFSGVELTFRRWSNYSGGLYDYRPGCRGLVGHSTAGMMVEGVAGLAVDGMTMRWSKHGGGGGEKGGWDNPLQFRSSTVDDISFHDWSSSYVFDS